MMHAANPQSGWLEAVPSRIFLVDDHPAVRQGLVLLLGQDRHVVCGEAGSLAEVLQAIDAARPDLALVDLSLGDESGIDLLTLLHARKLPVLVYSMHEDAVSIERCFRAGALAYVSKREESRVLLAGVRAALGGQRYVSPRAAQALAGRVIMPFAAETGLSEREAQILRLLGEGASNTEIASALAISVRTMESYCARIIDKLQLSGMRELRQHAIRNR